MCGYTDKKQRIYHCYILNYHLQEMELPDRLVVCSFANFLVFLSAANFERSNLYLKLFKLVFGSVSLFANENEQMLKVYTELRHIIGSSDIIAKRIYSLSVNIGILDM